MDMVLLTVLLVALLLLRVLRPAMTALAADAEYTVRAARETSIQIVNSEEIFKHALVAIVHNNSSTSANRGRLNAFVAGADYIPWGWAEKGATGDTSATPPTPAKVAVDGGEFLLPVSGLAGTFADVGREVWASNDGTFSLSRAAQNAFVGVTTAFESSTYVWVSVCVGINQIIHQLSVTRYDWTLGTIPLAQTPATISVTGISHKLAEAPHHGKFVDFAVFTGGIGTTNDVVTAQLVINSTNVSGASVALTDASHGATTFKQASSLGTSTIFFHEGDDIKVKLTTTSANSIPTVGLITCKATVQTMLGF